MPEPVKKEERHISLIKKRDALQNLVWAEVYAPGFPDTHGEFMSSESVRKAAYKFMENMRLHKIDENHNHRSLGVWVVESFVARDSDPDFYPGAWVVCLQVTDEVMDKIEKDELNGLSMEGLAIKEPRVIEIEVPEKIRGKTIKTVEEDHQHEFMVEFNDDGSIIGQTDLAGNPKHRHLIRRATATEKVDPQGKNVNHSHRFSIIEHLKGLDSTDED